MVGVNNSQAICELGELPLSSVDPSRKQQGYEAAAMALSEDFSSCAVPDNVPHSTVMGGTSFGISRSERISGNRTNGVLC